MEVKEFRKGVGFGVGVLGLGFCGWVLGLRFWGLGVWGFWRSGIAWLASFFYIYFALKKKLYPLQ